MHTITDNDLFHRLAFDNPWWEFKPETQIQFRHPPKRSFFPAFYNEVMKITAGNVLVLAGPLRAGKTVMMRQMVAQLIEHGVSPHSVLYTSMTTPSYAAADLATLFEMFCRRYRHGPDAELYIFFDEIQYVKEWEKMVLRLAKMRPKAHITGAVSACAPAITTGAKTHDGRITTFVLPPLTFLEFLRFRETEPKLFGTSADGAGGMQLVKNGLPHLDAEFHRYVNFGGFLEGVMGKAESAPAPTFIRDGLADRVLHKDLASLYGVNDAQELNRLLAILAFNTAREVSMDDLAKAANIAKNTLRKYLDYLESAFLIRRVQRVDQNAQKFQRAVAFKVYLTAPCLYSALFAPVPANDQFFQRLAETALVSQCLGSTAIDDLAYASWRGGNVDMMALDPASGRPDHVYEIDWNNSYAVPGKKPESLVSFVQTNNARARTYILTRSLARPATMRGVNITLAPLSLYTYWLQRDPTIRNFHGHVDDVSGPSTAGSAPTQGRIQAAPAPQARPQQATPQARPQQASPQARPQQASPQARPQQAAQQARPQQASQQARPQQTAQQARPLQPTPQARPAAPAPQQARPQAPAPQQPAPQARPQQASPQARPQQPAPQARPQQNAQQPRPPAPAQQARPAAPAPQQTRPQQPPAPAQQARPQAPAPAQPQPRPAAPAAPGSQPAAPNAAPGVRRA